jgi:two-component system chemotaxis response regulator CheY
MRNLVNMTLTDEGFEVIEACDGRDALKKLTGQKIHLVISDVNMPNMDGITFVTEMKKLAPYKFVPVVMLTTEGSDEKKKAGQAAGAKAWVVKPFQPAQLLAGVRKLLMM